jgi:hypothetical protein
MMKAKVFTGKGGEALEKDINEWLRSPGAKVIRFVTQSSNEKGFVVVTVWYEASI